MHTIITSSFSRQRLPILLALASLALVAIACSSNVTPTPEPITETTLIAAAKSAQGYVWYKKSDALLAKSSFSPRAETLLRARYNSVAANQLDANGKVKSGAVFGEGSIIVKELFSNQTTLSRTLVMWRQKDDVNMDEFGWGWATLSSTGTLTISPKGAACKGCHSTTTPHIDYTLMNLSQP